jgi:hypothetical protein
VGLFITFLLVVRDNKVIALQVVVADLDWGLKWPTYEIGSRNTMFSFLLRLKIMHVQIV